MIILFNPRSTKPRNCRLPLSVLALAAVLEGREEYAIVDGNIANDVCDGDKPRGTPAASAGPDCVGRVFSFDVF
jgi:hypothetical protein